MLFPQQGKCSLSLKIRSTTVQLRELCSVLRGSLGGREVWGRMDTCICMAEPLCCSPETITTLLISYTPVQNKKVKKKKRLGQILSYSTLIFYFIIINKLKIIFYISVFCTRGHHLHEDRDHSYLVLLTYTDFTSTFSFTHTPKKPLKKNLYFKHITFLEWFVVPSVFLDVWDGNPY